MDLIDQHLMILEEMVRNVRDTVKFNELATKAKKLAEEIKSKSDVDSSKSIDVDGLFIREVLDEIARARSKFKGNVDNYVALVEEVGELAQALLQMKHQPEKGKSEYHVFSEAVQVAVMAMRVATEGDSNFTYNPKNLIFLKG